MRPFPLLLMVVSLGCDKPAAFVGVEKEDAAKSDGEKVDAQTIEVGKRQALKWDINGDGFADFLVGAPNSSAILSQSGQAFVVLGGKNLLAQPSLTIGSDIVLDQLGYGVAMAGDVNGDGFGDFLVLTNGNETNVGSQAGRALLFFGGPMVKSTPDMTFAAGVVDDANGPIAGCGDLNGDGYDDIAFAAMDVDAQHMGILPVRVEIHFGGPAMATSAPLVLLGEAQPDFFGSSLSAAGDVNGDGYPDLIVGSHQGAGSGGKVRIYFGGLGMDSVADVVLEPPTESRLFGFSVTGVGDINGDGYDDVAVGAPSDDASFATPGNVYVYFGGAQPHLTPDLILPSDHQGAWFGIVVAPAGDVDHDGYSDLAVLERGLPSELVVMASGQTATPGKVFLYRGGIHPDVAPFATMTAGADFRVARSLAVIDLDGDGESEILVGQQDRYASSPVTGQVAIYRRSNNFATPALVIHNQASADSWFGSAISH